MSLPYDATPPPSPPRATEAKTDAQDAEDPHGLDRPLDEYKPAIPDHVQSLMGRMSQGKVYLLEETPAILHTGAMEGRVKGDPRIAELAAQLDDTDPTEWLSSSSGIRHSALYIESDLIKHLSTSKVFSWITGLGAGIMGIEWLNDTSLHLLFPSPSSALLALSLISKAGFDPAEGDDPLLLRSAHSVPLSLLPQAGLEPEDQLAGTELLGSSAPAKDDGVKRKGRGAFGGMASASDEFGENDNDDPSGARGAIEGFRLAEGVDPNARVTVRFGLEGDKELRQKARQSEWYARHGRQAGKEVSSSSRNSPYSRPGSRSERGEELSWEGRGSGEGREFMRRIGRERDSGRSSRGGRESGGGRGRNGLMAKTAADLDRELDGLRRGEAGSGGAGAGNADGGDVEMSDSSGRDRRGGRRPRRGKDDLDKELDDLFAARTTTST